MMFDQITTLPVIDAERFILRPLRRSDSGLLQMHSGDVRVAKATKSMPHPMPPGAVLLSQFVRRSSMDLRDRTPQADS